MRTRVSASGFTKRSRNAQHFGLVFGAAHHDIALVLFTSSVRQGGRQRQFISAGLGLDINARQCVPDVTICRGKKASGLSLPVAFQRGVGVRLHADLEQARRAGGDGLAESSVTVPGNAAIGAAPSQSRERVSRRDEELWRRRAIVCPMPPSSIDASRDAKTQIFLRLPEERRALRD